MSREATWVCPCLQRLGLRQARCLTGPALFASCSACYCGGGGATTAVVLPSGGSPSTRVLWFALLLSFWVDDVIETSSQSLTDVILKYSSSLVMLSGVALIGLEGVNLVFLRVSPKFITTFSMLPDPIPYSESESLSRRRFRFLVSRFLRTFSSLSNLSLNWAKDCFAGLGLFFRLS